MEQNNQSKKLEIIPGVIAEVIAIDNPKEAKLSVNISQDCLKEKAATAWTAFSKRHKIDGFRSDKTDRIPKSLLERKFKQLHGAQASMEEYVAYQIADQLQLQILQKADIAPQDVQYLARENWKMHEMSASYELLLELTPDFEALDATQVKITEYEAAPTTEDVRAAMSHWATKHTRGVPCEARPAKDGDTLRIDFSTNSVQGAADVQKDFVFCLGTGAFVPDFESKFIGKSAGDKVTHAAQLPKSVAATASLNSDQLIVSAEIKEVMDTAQHQVDKHMALALGRANLEKVEEDFEAQLKHEIVQMNFALNVDEIEGFVDVHYSYMKLPARRLNAEEKNLWKQVFGLDWECEEQAFKEKAEGINLSKAQAREKISYLASRNLCFHLVVDRFRRDHNIELGAIETEQAFREAARNFPMGGDNLVGLLKQNPEWRRNILSQALTTETLRSIIKKCTKSTQKCSLTELKDRLREAHNNKNVFAKAKVEEKPLNAESAKLTGNESNDTRKKPVKPRAKKTDITEE